MNPSDRIHIDRLRADVRALERRLGSIPSRWAGTSRPQTLQILHGQDVGSGIIGISYSPTCLPTTLYDPDLDTDFLAGLGSAYLWAPGLILPTIVLVRHDNDAHPGPALEGMTFGVANVDTLAVDSGPNAGDLMTVYRFTWP